MSDSAAKAPLRLKERLETLCTEMIDRGILFSEAVSQFERCFITECVRRSDGNLTRAAAELGVHRNTLAKRIQSYKPKRR